MTKINRTQYRCTFNSQVKELSFDNALEKCKAKAHSFIENGILLNVSFYKYENMGFLYVESIADSPKSPICEIAKSGSAENFKYPAEDIMADLIPYLKPWPEEDHDLYFVPMINVYYHHIPDNSIDTWEYERTTDKKTRVGRVAFVYPDKLPSYVMHHNAIVEEGLLKGDKYAYISMHENILFSYYEEPRNNVNITNIDEESSVINNWLKADPESHFDREKAKGSNFLVIPCLFSIDKVDLKQ